MYRSKFESLGVRDRAARTSSHSARSVSFDRDEDGSNMDTTLGDISIVG